MILLPSTYYVAQTINNQVPMVTDEARAVLQDVGLDAANVAAGKAQVDLFVAKALFPDLLPVLGIASNADA